ncbi:hypothetical protein EJB05_33833, partial [Eragrostis curvula]
MAGVGCWVFLLSVTAAALCRTISGKVFLRLDSLVSSSRTSSRFQGEELLLLPVTCFSFYFQFYVTASFEWGCRALGFPAAVVARCQGLFVDFLSEFADDGVFLVGVDIEVPPLVQRGLPPRVFFWSSPEITTMSPYEQAAFRAVAFLQSLCTQGGLSNTSKACLGLLRAAIKIISELELLRCII